MPALAAARQAESELADIARRLPEERRAALPAEQSAFRRVLHEEWPAAVRTGAGGSSRAVPFEDVDVPRKWTEGTTPATT
ncbi:hypothetical protein [Streptomyces sp. NBC_01506]|uniref:hypothetical protein n=1 Tax=Streptomyces sp. NBC_01506 TaxID=2903887 RepID=UPI00386C731A